MIFPKLNYERIVQVEDKLRLDASMSFTTKGEEITGVRIKPSELDGFIDVFAPHSENWFMDWAYSDAGEKLITVEVSTEDDTIEKDFIIEVVSTEDDALLSSDQDLYPYEPTINKYLPIGKSSFIYAHRAAQTKILAYLDEQRIWKHDNSRYTKDDLIAIEDPEFKNQFKMWSLFQTLLIIFESSQVSVNDVFQEKRTEYEKEMRIHRNRASLRLDSDGDGVLDIQPRNIRTTRLLRR
jgi:hypothetical protein